MSDSIQENTEPTEEKDDRSAKQKIGDFFIANMGKVVTSKQLDEAAKPTTEWARRLRELRNQEGWPISSHHDDETLKPNEYRLEGPPPKKYNVKFDRTINARVRAQVLDRNGFTCQSCGIAAGDIDPATDRKVRFHIGHIVDKSLGGSDEVSNLRTLCSTCNQGAKNITSEKPSRVWLLSQVRRASRDDQRAVQEWLNKKFGTNSDE